MTGFASGEGTLTDGRGFGWTVKSVNHRHLDLAVRVPDALETAVRKAVKARVRRGHVEVTLNVERVAGAVGLDEKLLAAYGVAFRRACEVLGVAQAVDVNGLLRMPGVMAVGAGVTAVAEEEVMGLLGEVMDRFEAVRVGEGAALEREMRAGMGRVGVLAEEAGVLRAGVAGVEFERLKVRMGELVGGNVGEERLLVEAGLLAGRGDIEEELVRLRTHVGRFCEILDGGGEVGRALDFLLQEMNREANTALSKTGGSAGEAGLRLTEIGLGVKVELERVREQVQNLE